MMDEFLYEFDACGWRLYVFFVWFITYRVLVFCFLGFWVFGFFFDLVWCIQTLFLCRVCFWLVLHSASVFLCCTLQAGGVFSPFFVDCTCISLFVLCTKYR